MPQRPAVAAGEDASGEDLVGERDDENGERRGHEVDDVADRGCRHGQSRQPRLEVADDGDPVRGEVERPGGADRGDDHDQPAGQARQKASQEEERGERARADDNGNAAYEVELTDVFG